MDGDKTSDTRLGQGTEFDMIRGIWSRIRGPSGTGSPGDDCAFFEVGEERLAISCDLSIEGTHFRFGWLEPREVGWRAATAALSDLAAVAASPLGLVVSVGVSREHPHDLAAEVMEGVADAAAAVEAQVWGGDLVRHDRVVIDVTVVGRFAGSDRRIERRGAREGDALYVTGSLGGPAAALAAWQEGREPASAARRRFAHPSARIHEARWLAARGARAMIDVSDGLRADAGHLAAASDVRCVIELDGVPVHPGAHPAPGESALVGGEEFELLVVLEDDATLATAFAEEFDLPLTRIGRMESGSGVVVMRGEETLADPEVFQHF